MRTKPKKLGKVFNIRGKQNTSKVRILNVLQNLGIVGLLSKVERDDDDVADRELLVVDLLVQKLLVRHGCCHE